MEVSKAAVFFACERRSTSKAVRREQLASCNTLGISQAQRWHAFWRLAELKGSQGDCL